MIMKSLWSRRFRKRDAMIEFSHCFINNPVIAKRLAKEYFESSRKASKRSNKQSRRFFRKNNF